MNLAQPLYTSFLYALALVGIFVAAPRFVGLALAVLAYETLAAMAFVGATRYRVSTDFLLALLGRKRNRLGAAAPAHVAVKVLHVHRVRGIGGSERHLLTLLPALAERGHDVRFLGLDDTSGEPDPFYAQLDRAVRTASAPRDIDPALGSRGRRADAGPPRPRPHAPRARRRLRRAAVRAARLTKHNDDPFRAGPFRHAERRRAPRFAR